MLVASLVGWRMFAPLPNLEDVVDANSPYVVVVPFDVSGDASGSWRPFADQVTRELIRNLGKDLRPEGRARDVGIHRSRTTRCTITSGNQLPEVQYVLDGVVSISAGNSLRITAELEDLRTGQVVWDKHYEGRTDDTNLFAMQSGIAAAVSESLKVAILGRGTAGAGRVPDHQSQGLRGVCGRALSAGPGEP